MDRPIRLQPRQLYDMILQKHYALHESIEGKLLKKFGGYTDRDSIDCACEDFGRLIDNYAQRIEIINGPIEPRQPGSKHVPYLHDICSNNDQYTITLGLNRMTDITWGKIITGLSQPFLAHIKLICDAKETFEEPIDREYADRKDYSTKESRTDAQMELKHQMRSHFKLERIAQDPNLDI